MHCPDCAVELLIGMWPFRCRGTGDHALTSHNPPNIHPSDRVVYFENAKGEIRIPGRADRPIHPKYTAAGFIRREAQTIQDVKRLEKRTGKISEVLNYDRNSARADRDVGSA